VAGASTHVAAEGAGGSEGADQDCAAAGIAPVQGALRAAQQLDALEVEQLAGELRRMHLQHAVDDGRDRWLAVAHLRQAADRQCRVAGVLRLGQADVRGQRDEVAGSIDAGIVERLRGQHGDADRYVVYVLVAVARQHQHRLGDRHGGRGVGAVAFGMHGGRRQGCQHHDRGGRDDPGSGHLHTPPHKLAGC
jgi:hypothetical protein